MPSIVGKNLLQTIPLLSDKNLNIRILTKKAISDLPSGTILSQTPKEGALIKPQQPVFVVLSEKPPKIPTPSVIHKKQDIILKNLQSLEIRNKSYFLQSSIYPDNLCIAQSPEHYFPLAYPNAAKRRRNIVLGQMKKLQYITQDKYEKLVQLPLCVKSHTLHCIAPHLREHIRIFLEKLVGKQIVYSGGLRVQTTINKKTQKLALHSFNTQHDAVLSG